MSSELFALDGRVAIVTGGNAGLGLVMARALQGAGAHVSIGDLSQEQSTEAIEAFGRDCVLRP